MIFTFFSRKKKIFVQKTIPPKQIYCQYPTTTSNNYSVLLLFKSTQGIGLKGLLAALKN